MSSMSVRAFDQAQRRKKYPERKGALGLACMQRDILHAQGQLSQISQLLWAATFPNNTYTGYDPDSVASLRGLNEQLAEVGLVLLQLTGALGIDLMTLMRHRLEKEELTVL